VHNRGSVEKREERLLAILEFYVSAFFAVIMLLLQSTLWRDAAKCRFVGENKTVRKLVFIDDFARFFG
jgi:hypothetical protein